MLELLGSRDSGGELTHTRVLSVHDFVFLAQLIQDLLRALDIRLLDCFVSLGREVDLLDPLFKFNRVSISAL